MSLVATNKRWEMHYYWRYQARQNGFTLRESTDAEQHSRHMLIRMAKEVQALPVRMKKTEMVRDAVNEFLIVN